MVQISEQTARYALVLFELANGKTAAQKLALGQAQLELEQALATSAREVILADGTHLTAEENKAALEVADRIYAQHPDEQVLYDNAPPAGNGQ